MQYNREGTANMARYELSKDDFAILAEALATAARATESRARVMAGVRTHGAHRYRALAERFANAHSAYLDEDGND